MKVNQTQISAILQDEKQLHYIDQQSLKNSQFLSEQDFSSIEQPEQLIYESTLHPKLFYSKKTMKDLLQERSSVCEYLKIKPSKPDKNKIEEQIQSRQKVLKILKKVFQDSPSLVDENILVNISDCLATYSFFSTDGRFVPLCKLCNSSAYAITRGSYCKVVCSNKKCRIKILAEHQQINKVKIESRKFTEKSETVSKINSSSKISHQSIPQRVYTKEELAMIKKTANKIVYS